MFGKILEVFSGGIIKDIGEAIDENITSDEERMTLLNKLEEIKAKAKEKQQEFLGKVEEQLTARHSADMMSDSWLSKNIRPLTLLSLTIVTVFYIIIGVLFNADKALFETGLAALVSLDLMVYGFYFGSRGVEKATASIAAAITRFKAQQEDKKKKPPKPDDEDFDNEIGW